MMNKDEMLKRLNKVIVKSVLTSIECRVRLNSDYSNLLDMLEMLVPELTNLSTNPISFDVPINDGTLMHVHFNNHLIEECNE